MMDKDIFDNRIMYRASDGSTLIFDTKSGINQSMLASGTRIVFAQYETVHNSWEFYFKGGQIATIIPRKELLYISERPFKR